MLAGTSTNKFRLSFKFDLKRPYIQPWKQSRSGICRNFTTRFAKPSSLPIYPLASYPGSGNTWVRYLIEGLTGVFTGDIYQDKRLNHLFLGTKENYRVGTTFGAKTHKKYVIIFYNERKNELNIFYLGFRTNEHTKYWIFFSQSLRSPYETEKGLQSAAYRP